MAERELVDKAVSSMFSTVFNRIKYIDQLAIIEASKNVQDASLNGNNSSQLEAQKKLDDAIHDAIKNVIDYDMNIIKTSITKNEIFIRMIERLN